MGRKLDCPQCQGRNFYYTSDNDVGYCFNCGYTERGNTVNQKERYTDIPAIRQLYTELTEYYHSCLERKHIDYLVARGITEQAIVKYKLGYCPNAHHILYNAPESLSAGLYGQRVHLGSRIVFPYFLGQLVTDIRGRYFGNGSTQQKYLSPFNSSFYRGADYAYNHNVLHNPSVVITEGEMKAIASTEAGIACLALPGMRSFRPGIKQYDDQTTIICFDTQIAHYYDVRRAIIDLAKRFHNPKVATLPATKGKQDIDSYILEYGKERYAKVIQRALPFDIWKGLSR